MALGGSFEAGWSEMGSQKLQCSSGEDCAPQRALPGTSLLPDARGLGPFLLVLQQLIVLSLF